VGADSVQLEQAVSKAVTNYCSGPEFASHLRDTVREEVDKKLESSKPPSTLDISDSSQFEDPKKSCMANAAQSIQPIYLE
jgi:hypothetical protein